MTLAASAALQSIERRPGLADRAKRRVRGENVRSVNRRAEQGLDLGDPMGPARAACRCPSCAAVERVAHRHKHSLHRMRDTKRLFPGPSSAPPACDSWTAAALFLPISGYRLRSLQSYLDTRGCTGLIVGHTVPAVCLAQRLRRIFDRDRTQAWPLGSLPWHHPRSGGQSK